MRTAGKLSFFLLLIISCACTKKTSDPVNPPVVTPVPPAVIKTDISAWITKPDKSALLQLQTNPINFGTVAENNTIEVDDSQVFQSIDGFGFTLTGGSATLINQLPAAEKDALLKELFSSADNAIAISYLRISIGASDLSANVFTYNEMPAGKTDESMSQFSISTEMTDMVPILKKILEINPSIKILGSPWTAPTWMKTNNAYKGGTLRREYYAAYADYFIKYILAMKVQGIPIDAITVQNEPLHAGNVPSMYMEANEQADFIRTALGPAFKNAGITTKIIIYDHNADRPDYPLSILADADAAKYIDGAAFHLYGGNITALTTVRDAFPTKNIYFTEQWVGGPGNFATDLQWHVVNLIIGATRNWSRNVLEWNLAADVNYGPHTDGGCTTCLGALTIGENVSKNVSYYIIGHASKFVPTGSVRIYSNTAIYLPNVAFKRPDGKKVLIVANTGTADQKFGILYKGKTASTILSAGAVATYVW